MGPYGIVVWVQRLCRSYGSVWWCASSGSLECCGLNESSLASGMAWVHMVLWSGSNGSVEDKGHVGHDFFFFYLLTLFPVILNVRKGLFSSGKFGSLSPASCLLSFMEFLQMFYQDNSSPPQYVL